LRRYVTALAPALGALGAPLSTSSCSGIAADVPAGLAHEPEPRHPPTNLVDARGAADRGQACRRSGCTRRYTHRVGIRTPVVVTIHDVSYERHPGGIPIGATGCGGILSRQRALGHAGHHRLRVFGVGDQAAYHPRDRIDVVPLGVPRFDGARPRRVGNRATVRVARRRSAPSGGTSP
jgi:hypothetical protein